MQVLGAGTAGHHHAATLTSQQAAMTTTQATAVITNRSMNASLKCYRRVVRSPLTWCFTPITAASFAALSTWTDILRSGSRMTSYTWQRVLHQWIKVSYEAWILLKCLNVAMCKLQAVQMRLITGIDTCDQLYAQFPIVWNSFSVYFPNNPARMCKTCFWCQVGWSSLCEHNGSTQDRYYRAGSKHWRF